MIYILRHSWLSVVLASVAQSLLFLIQLLVINVSVMALSANHSADAVSKLVLLGVSWVILILISAFTARRVIVNHAKSLRFVLEEYSEGSAKEKSSFLSYAVIHVVEYAVLPITLVSMSIKAVIVVSYVLFSNLNNIAILILITVSVIIAATIALIENFLVGKSLTTHKARSKSLRRLQEGEISLKEAATKIQVENRVRAAQTWLDESKLLFGLPIAIITLWTINYFDFLVISDWLIYIFSASLISKFFLEIPGSLAQRSKYNHLFNSIRNID